MRTGMIVRFFGEVSFVLGDDGRPVEVRITHFVGGERIVSRTNAEEKDFAWKMFSTASRARRDLVIDIEKEKGK
jgi:hypothetical protein